MIVSLFVYLFAICVSSIKTQVPYILIKLFDWFSFCLVSAVFVEGSLVLLMGTTASSLWFVEVSFVLSTVWYCCHPIRLDYILLHSGFLYLFSLGQLVARSVSFLCQLGVIHPLPCGVLATALAPKYQVPSHTNKWFGIDSSLMSGEISSGVACTKGGITFEGTYYNIYL